MAPRVALCPMHAVRTHAAGRHTKGALNAGFSRQIASARSCFKRPLCRWPARGGRRAIGPLAQRAHPGTRTCPRADSLRLLSFAKFNFVRDIRDRSHPGATPAKPGDSTPTETDFRSRLPFWDARRNRIAGGSSPWDWTPEESGMARAVSENIGYPCADCRGRWANGWARAVSLVDEGV